MHGHGDASFVFRLFYTSSGEYVFSTCMKDDVDVAHPISSLVFN
jgi:hypothetical protein